MPATGAGLRVTGTVAADSGGIMLVLSERLDGHDTFLTGSLDFGDSLTAAVRILTLDDVTVLRLDDRAAAPPLSEGSWAATLHLPHGQRPPAIPPDLSAAARQGRRDLTVLDTAELRYVLTFLGEATTESIRRARIQAIVMALPITQMPS